MSLTRLSEEDVRILELESPTIAGHMCKLMIAERPPAAEPLTLDALRDAVAARLGEAPRLAQKLVPTPLGLANPVWADDPAFDIANHVRRVETGGAVDREGLHRIVAELMAERLDRSRPLWTLDLVEHLAGGDAALIWRVHHCMADGITAFRLGSQAIWTSGHEPAGSRAEPWHADPEPGALALAALGAHDRLRHMLGGVSALGRTLLRSPWRLRSAASAAARMPAVLARELMPGAAVATFDRHPGAERVVATAEVPLAELKRIEKAFGDGITVNDVVLTAVGGALRRSLASRGESLKDVRAKVPTSLHRQDERDALGNHDSFMFVDLALSDEDPVERLLDINRAPAGARFTGTPRSCTTSSGTSTRWDGRSSISPRAGRWTLASSRSTSRTFPAPPTRSSCSDTGSARFTRSPRSRIATRCGSRSCRLPERSRSVSARIAPPTWRWRRLRRASRRSSLS